MFRKVVENERFIFEDMNINLTITIGMKEFVGGKDLQKWVDLADEKMYSGKRSGKNKTVA